MSWWAYQDPKNKNFFRAEIEEILKSSPPPLISKKSPKYADHPPQCWARICSPEHILYTIFMPCRLTIVGKIVGCLIYSDASIGFLGSLVVGHEIMWSPLVQNRKY